MGVDTLTKIADKLREFGNFAQNNSVYRDIEVTDEYYECDLGQFGYVQTSVTVEQTEYEFEVSELFDDAPIQPGDFDDLADELEEFEIPEQKADLDSVLTAMESNGEGPLARAIRAVIDVFKEQVMQPMVNLSGLSVGALPPKPLPWPGALRNEIDYTAEDFPFRYNPPPGWCWTSPRSQRSALAPDKAEAFLAGEVTSQQMILDNKGRISWIERDDDDLSSGRRWSVWFLDYLGIPPASGDFTTSTKPLALDADGQVIGEWVGSNGQNSATTCAPWKTEAIKASALSRVAQIKGEYEQSLKPLNGSGASISYDPLTIGLMGGTIRARSADLRLGDLLLSYGRVLSVTREPNDRVTIETNGSDGTTTYRGTDYNWTITPIDVADRDLVPTALSLSSQNGASYDPLTVRLLDYEESVTTDDLRLGEDITGPEFGRVISIEERGDGRLIRMNREGEVNEYLDRNNESWSVLKIAENREAAPKALNGETPMTSVEYDPLSVELKAQAEYGCRSDELRLGEDITGPSFGRVTGIRDESGVLKLVLNRNGKERLVNYTPASQWSILQLARSDRDSVPTAISLYKEQSVPAPF